MSLLRIEGIEVDGRRLDGLAPAEVTARGIAHVPEGRQLFPTMTVRENLELGARTRAARQARPRTLARVFELFPRLLVRDEPSLGRAPVLVKTIFEDRARINREGLTVLLVEQNVLRSLQLAHRGYVLENGRTGLDRKSVV